MIKVKKFVSIGQEGPIAKFRDGQIKISTKKSKMSKVESSLQMSGTCFQF